MQDRLSPVFVLHVSCSYDWLIGFWSFEMLESRARPNRINIDLQGYKASWVAYCERNGTTPSDAFRQIVAKLIEGEQKGDSQLPRGVAADEPEKPSRRCEVRLTASEITAAQAVAAREGFALPRWIVGLLRARLTGTPQFGQSELEALAKSNLHLLAIGRNLNQVAKALNASTADRSAYRIDLVEQIRDVIAEHTSKVALLMSANTERWKIR